MSNTTSLRPCPRCGTSYGRRAAHVHRHAALGARDEVDLRARSGVVDPEHRARLASTPAASSQFARFRESGVSCGTAARPPTPRCPRPGRSRRAPRPASGRTDTSMPWPIGSRAAPARRRGWRPSPTCAARARASRPRSRCRRCRSTSRRAATRPTTSASSAIESASRRLLVGAGNSVPRSGRPAGPSSASATACATASPSEWPARRGASAIRTPPSTSGGASPNGCTSKPSPTRFLTSRAPSSSACASSRSSASVSLRLRRSPSTTTTRAAVGLDERGVVGVDAADPRARPAARRRGTPAASAPRRGRRAEPSRRRGRRARASRCRTTGSAGHRAVGAVGDRVRSTSANSARDASGRAASCTTTMSASAGTSASPARTESERVAPPAATLHTGGRVPVRVRGQHHDHAVARLAARRRPRGRARSRRRGARTAWPRRSALPPPAATTIAQVRIGPVSRVSGDLRSSRRANSRRPAVGRHDRRHLEHHLGTADELARRRSRRPSNRRRDGRRPGPSSLPSRVSETRTKSPGTDRRA